MMAYMWIFMQVAPEKLRSAIGSIIAEGSESLDPELVKAYTDHEYKVFTFPAVQNVFYTSFPFKGALSVLIGLKRVYPALIEYTAVRRFCIFLMNTFLPCLSS